MPRDKLDREFIEGGIDALWCMSKGGEMLPSWTITRYEVDRDVKIGIGFFSDVYKGTWHGCTVVIKWVLHGDPKGANILVHQQAGALRQMAHTCDFVLCAPYAVPLHLTCIGLDAGPKRSEERSGGKVLQYDADSYYQPLSVDLAFWLAWHVPDVVVPHLGPSAAHRAFDAPVSAITVPNRAAFRLAWHVPDVVVPHLGPSAAHRAFDAPVSAITVPNRAAFQLAWDVPDRVVPRLGPSAAHRAFDAPISAITFVDRAASRLAWHVPDMVVSSLGPSAAHHAFDAPMSAVTFPNRVVYKTDWRSVKSRRRPCNPTHSGSHGMYLTWWYPVWVHPLPTAHSTRPSLPSMFPIGQRTNLTGAASNPADVLVIPGVPARMGCT
ncbi:hypothetical protein B0H13DRAFT_2542714 [Mycena leptocephala]|nr:hypothetical protein B0H13DRAFT_2542714 [Mycena leptocephala]